MRHLGSLRMEYTILAMNEPITMRHLREHSEMESLKELALDMDGLYCSFDKPLTGKEVFHKEAPFDLVGVYIDNKSNCTFYVQGTVSTRIRNKWVHELQALISGRPKVQIERYSASEIK